MAYSVLIILVQGSLTLNGKRMDFTGGRGYIEKDWGQSFPAAWVWFQSNHFKHGSTCITASVAIIPWKKRTFRGFIVGLWLDEKLYRFAQGMRGGIPDLIAIIVISFLAVMLGRLLDRHFRAVTLHNISLPGFHPETAEPTRRIAKALLWLFAVIIMYPYLPASDWAAFKGVSVFAGLLVSFGSAGIAGQLMAGLALMYSRGYHIGDFVLIGDHQGTVSEIGLLTTRLRTVKDEYVSIPNSVVLTGGTVNYSAAGREGHTHRGLFLNHFYNIKQVMKKIIKINSQTA